MDALKQALDVPVELIRGHGGVFKVRVDGAIVAEKAMGVFPTEPQIVEAVRGAL